MSHRDSAHRRGRRDANPSTPRQLKSHAQPGGQNAALEFSRRAASGDAKARARQSLKARDIEIVVSRYKLLQLPVFPTKGPTGASSMQR